jgi:hypothetical protein
MIFKANNNSTEYRTSAPNSPISWVEVGNTASIGRNNSRNNSGITVDSGIVCSRALTNRTHSRNISGITVGDWHRGESYRYDGIMAYDEANAAIDRDAADVPAMGPVGEGPAADDAAIDRDAAIVPAIVPADARRVTDLDP